MKWPLWLLGGIAAASLVWGSCASQRATRFQSERDSTLGANAVLAAQNAALAAQGASATAQADRWEGEANHHAVVAESLTALLHRPRPPVPLPDPTAADSARYWREVSEGLQARLWVAGEAIQQREAEVVGLRSALDSQKVATARYKLAWEGEATRAEAAEALLRKAPTGCPRIPLLNLPMPKVGPGVALTTEGVVPALALVIPLGC